tara:strand:- start:558 stop:737 length:180 start_codon:yes stop_codon:yes gene_type:complete
MVLSPNSAKDLIPYFSVLYDLENGKSEQRGETGREYFLDMRKENNYLTFVSLGMTAYQN